MKIKLLASLVLLAGCGSTGVGSFDGGSTPGTDAGSATVFNGCTADKFVDSTATADTAVAFGGSLTFSPACVIIAAGHSVTYNGNFGFHPLKKGSPTDSTAGAANNPIVETSTGTTPLTVVFPTVGDYPYYCGNHFSDGMMGVVRVR